MKKGSRNPKRKLKTSRVRKSLNRYAEAKSIHEAKVKKVESKEDSKESYFPIQNQKNNLNFLKDKGILIYIY